MNLKQLWRRTFSKQPKPSPFRLEEGHVIVPAFKSGGVQYYQLKDIFNSFCMRAMDALAVFENWQMRCTRQFLIDHTKAIDAILRDPKKVNVVDIADLNNKLMERLEWAIPTEEIIYQLASVAYFDENESPYKYDNKYCEEKIKRWKAENEIDGFFLVNHMRDILPSPDFSSRDLTMLMEMIAKIDKVHLQKVTSILSSQVRSSGSGIKLS